MNQKLVRAWLKNGAPHFDDLAIVLEVDVEELHKFMKDAAKPPQMVKKRFAETFNRSVESLFSDRE